MLTVTTRTKMQGTDSRWYTPLGGFPVGVKWTGATRIEYAWTDGRTTFGKAYPTHQEAQEALDRYLKGQ